MARSGSRPGFAARQAAQRAHQQRPMVRMAGGNVALRLNALEVGRLVDPLDETARAALLELGAEIAPLVDERPIEEQLADLRSHLDERFDELDSTIEPVKDVADEILRSQTESPGRRADADAAIETEPDTPERRIAWVTLVVYSLVTGVALGDPRLSALSLVLAWIAFAYGIRNDL